MFEVEFTNEYGEWFEELSDEEQESIAAGVELLRKIGPALGRPHVDRIERSRFPNMKELRTQCKGTPLRSFFAFDPRRVAILLIGGDKTGDGRFYDKMIPLADKLYATYLREIGEEGLI